MNKSIEQAVASVNQFVSDNLWFDFDVSSYDVNGLKIIGGIDLSYYHQIEITFSQVFCFHGPFSWHSDTSKPVLFLPSGNLARSINLRHGIEIGNTVFQFHSEDSENAILIAAHSCAVEIAEVHYK